MHKHDKYYKIYTRMVTLICFFFCYPEGGEALSHDLIDSGGYYLQRDLKSAIVSDDLGIEVATFTLENKERKLLFEGK